MGSDARIEEITESELLELWEMLDDQGVESRPRFTKIVSAKRLYHFDSLERLEKTVI